MEALLKAFGKGQQICNPFKILTYITYAENSTARLKWTYYFTIAIMVRWLNAYTKYQVQQNTVGLQIKRKHNIVNT